MEKVHIYALSLSALPNDKHMAIAEFMAQALQHFNIADTVVGRYVSAYFAAYEKESHAFKRIDRKELTKNLNDADADRINALRVLRDGLKIFNFIKDEEKKQLAQEILEVDKLYGGADIYSQPVDSRTGNINKFIQNLETSLAGAVRALHFESVVQNLKAANQHFLWCQSERDQSDADFGKNTMATARVETANIWRALVEEVNNALTYGTDEDREVLTPFAKFMNVEIDKYRIQTGQGVGGNWGNGAGSRADVEDGKIFRKATFQFVTGNMQRFRLEVGHPLPPLPNTPGYKWKPELTPQMPNRNIIFRELPIQ